MDKPTEARIKEFWERCGLTLVQHTDRYSSGTRNWIEYQQNGKRVDEPKLGLNELFQYAVPLTLEVLTKQGYCPAIMKLFQLWYDNLVTLSGDSSNVERANIALFWVCREVIYNGIGFQSTVTKTLEQLAGDELY